MEDCMQAFSFSFYLFHFTVYCCLPVAVDILSFFPSYPLYRHPTSNWLPLTLLSLCLTAVRLLWEVIRKSSTETHTAAAENKAFNRFYSLSLHYNSKRPGVRGRGWWGRVRGHYQDIFREQCLGENAALVILNFYVLKNQVFFFFNYLYLRLCHSEAKGLVCPCLAQWQLWSEDDTKTESVQKETHFSNLGQRWSCFSSLKQFVHFSKLRVIGSKPCSLQASKQNHRINPQ